MERPMSTCSGRHYTSELEMEGDAALDADLQQDPSSTAEDSQPSQAAQSPKTQPTSMDLTSLMSAFILQQQQQQLIAMLATREQEREQQRDENRQRDHTLAQILHTLSTRDREQHSFRPKLTCLTNDDDIEAYLITFERLMESAHLAPQLSGKAQKAYAALDGDTAKEYDDVKASILHRYAITKETYRLRFRKARK